MKSELEGKQAKILDMQEKEVALQQRCEERESELAEKKLLLDRLTGQSSEQAGPADQVEQILEMERLKEKNNQLNTKLQQEQSKISQYEVTMKLKEKLTQEIENKLQNLNQQFELEK